MAKKARNSSIAVVMMLSLLLSACSGNNEAVKPSPTTVPKTEAVGKPVKLRIMWWGGQARHDATLKALDFYSKKNPNVTFEPTYQTFDGYLEKLRTQSAGNNEPDIVQILTAWYSDYSTQLADVSSVNVSDIDAALVGPAKKNEKLYAVPFGKNAIGMVFNKPAFEKAGIPIPSENWKWDEFFKLTEEAKPKLGKNQYLIKDLTGDVYSYYAYQLGQGKGIARDAEGRFKFDKDTWITWMKKFAELRKAGLVTPPDVTVGDKLLDAKDDLLANNTILMKTANASEVSAYDSLKPGQIGVIPEPQGVQGSSWLSTSAYWAVSPESKNQEEAKKFIDWFINSPEASDILTTTRGIPASKKMIDYLQPKFTPVDKLSIELIDKVSKNPQQWILDPDAVPGWAKFFKEYINTCQMLMFDKLTPEQAWEQIVQSSKDLPK
ncbi:ABC transporter substrate-binding protein [Paenibacillus agricola]|uniref:Extracellular solute-binding protein n=1 Tax=Paenibacillus agricola TaxID=2716264 RepID=A0ABX0JHY5_9BACL|nr:extracellular solute-binding protein [Paenibacillus agricola]NHN34906.1 extracellular solute-binding protein [Paenibacillus agricola]